MEKEISITNYWYVKNYGACLTAYALYNLYEELGYIPFLVDNMTEVEHKNYNKIFNKNFCNKYCRIKKPEEINFAEKNQPILTTGSDQIFNPVITQDKLDDYLLRYGNINSKKIAIAGSFGVNKETFLKQNSPQTIEYMKNALKTFDYISVREKSGIEICKDVFGINAVWICDPVFITDKTKWEYLIENADIDSNGKIVSYLFDKTKEHKKALNHLSQKYKTDVIELDNYKNTPENWIKAIKDCRLFISNSFHGICFAIIFNKPFICLSKETGRSARFESMFEQLGIENRSVSLPDIFDGDYIFKIDYAKVNRKIEGEREKALNFIEEALNSSIITTDEKKDAEIKVLNGAVNRLKQQNNLSYQLKKLIKNKWLLIYYCYLPLKIRNLIQFIRYGKTWN